MGHLTADRSYVTVNVSHLLMTQNSNKLKVSQRIIKSNIPTKNFFALFWNYLYLFRFNVFFFVYNYIEGFWHRTIDMNFNKYLLT